MFNRIQEQPEHVKKRISLILTVILFGGIVFVWMSSRTARSVVEQSRTRTASPMESLKEVFNGEISGIRDTIMNAEFFGGEQRTAVPEETTSAVVEQPATSTPFDITGVVIIDLATSTKNAR